MHGKRDLVGARDRRIPIILDYLGEPLWVLSRRLGSEEETWGGKTMGSEEKKANPGNTGSPKNLGKNERETDLAPSLEGTAPLAPAFSPGRPECHFSENQSALL